MTDQDWPDLLFERMIRRSAILNFFLGHLLEKDSDRG